MVCTRDDCPIFAVVRDDADEAWPACRAHGRASEHSTVEVLQALRDALQACGHSGSACILQQLPIKTRGPQNRIRKGSAAKVDLGVLHMSWGLLGIEAHGRKERQVPK